VSLSRGGSSGSGLSIVFETLAGLLAAVVFLLWTLIQTRLENRRLVVVCGGEARCYIASVPRYVSRLTTTSQRPIRSTRSQPTRTARSPPLERGGEPKI